MREVFYSIMTAIGAMCACFFGGVDTLFIVLCAFIVIDYTSGLVVAFVFKNSTKTNSGGASSSVCFHGLCKKVFTLILVGVANMLDMALGTDFVRGGVIVAFISSETISIIENAGLMGIKIPQALQEALDMLSGRKE